MTSQEDIIAALGNDPVGALEMLTGAGRRTCERWASGAAAMQPHLVDGLAGLIGRIDAAAEKMSGEDGAILRIAASRFPSEPLI